MTRINHIKLGLLSAAACMAASCTGDFDSFNTNPDAVQQIDVKNYITTMERDAVIPTSDEGANEYQRACNLMGDTFGGYFAPIQAFNGAATPAPTTSTARTTTTSPFRWPSPT